MWEFKQPGGSHVPCSGRAAGVRPPVPGSTSWSAPPTPGPHTRPPPAALPPLQSFPGGRGPSDSQVNPRRSHQRFKTQRSGTPTPLAPSPLSGVETRESSAAAGKRPRSVRVPLGPLSLLVTQVRRARPKPRPPSPGTCRSRSQQDLPSPCSAGPRPVPAPLGPAPTAVSARSTATAAAHFRFPRTAETAAAPQESPQTPAPPRPARPRPAPPRPKGRLASALRTRGHPGGVGPRRRPRVGRETDAA